MEVIVLDGNQRSSLAAVRSLGGKGIKVAVGEEMFPSLSSHSKYCTHGFSYPSPYTRNQEFMEKIREVSYKNRGAILFPMTDVTLSEVLRNKADLSNYVQIPFVNYDKYNIASDKLGVLRVAADLHIPNPKTLFSPDFTTLDAMVKEASRMGFPLVLKPSHSRIHTADGWINAGVRYANNLKELREILDNEPFQSYPFLIQERIEGPGIGIFLLMDNGRIFSRFAHKRIREKPPHGGVSVLCQSITPPPEAMDAAVRLLESLEWSGVAMVEFKWDMRDNMPKLMEVNARFWGSLQLAISAGVDFPHLLFCLSRREKIRIPNDYKIGLKLRWELGDLDHLLIRLKEKPSAPFLQTNVNSKLKVLTNFIVDFIKPSIRNEILHAKDPTPFLFELKQYIRNILS